MEKTNLQKQLKQAEKELRLIEVGELVPKSLDVF